MLPYIFAAVLDIYNRNAKLAFKTNIIICLSPNRGSTIYCVSRRTNYRLAEKDVIRVTLWQRWTIGLVRDILNLLLHPKMTVRHQVSLRIRVGLVWIFKDELYNVM